MTQSTSVGVRDESESALIQRAQTAVSRCNWEVGECAAVWTKRFSRGRTDADFAALVSLSPDQVYQRRRVWETFADVYQNYPGLKWSHFYSALNWDDASECLQWAEDVQAGVAEMKAWRRAQRGEDLDARASDDEFGNLPTEAALAPERAPFDPDSSFTVSAGDTSSPATGGPQPIAGDGADAYAPFNATATRPPVQDAADRPPLSVEQIAKRLTSTIERCHALITDDFIQEFGELPDKVRKRFLKAIEQLAEKTADLS